MKRILTTLLIAQAIALAAVAQAATYVELPSDDPDCVEKIFPAREGLTCASGDWNNFTIHQITGKTATGGKTNGCCQR